MKSTIAECPMNDSDNYYDIVIYSTVIKTY